jgi:hypothetical protein
VSAEAIRASTSRVRQLARAPRDRPQGYDDPAAPDRPRGGRSYSVLTRLPPPHRASPAIVHSFITKRFTDPFLTLSENGYQELLATVAAGQIPGGPAYDTLIAFTAAEHNATLLSLDQRAAATYETVGAQVEQLLS